MMEKKEDFGSHILEMYILLSEGADYYPDKMFAEKYHINI